ncbi:regulatory particle non-ATPase [Pseudogymnoascus australis]
MAERELHTILQTLQTSTSDYRASSALLSRAKLLLLKLNALTPLPTTPPALLLASRALFETAALTAIRAKDPEAFTRYVHLLSPFYNLPTTVLSPADSQRAKITGLFLLLLLVKGDYAGFHTELEALEIQGADVEGDAFLGYPVRLERWLMEGSYDQVWKAMRSREVPSEEFGIFSEILIPRIRAEIASCSERAYPSLPVSSTKDLLFLDSEGAVVQFAQSRGWVVRDGRIYFPAQAVVKAEGEEREISHAAIENTLGYARELETIV